MASAIHRLPDAQLVELGAPYLAEMAARRRSTLLGLTALVLCILVSAIVAEVDLVRFFTNFGNFTSYLGRIFYLDTGASVFTDVSEWFWGLGKWSIKLLGTLLGAIAAFGLCFSASANLAPSKGRRFVVRRFLEFCRSVPEIVFALIFVVAFGLGPVPGVLAIMIHTAGALGKLFSEVVENIDLKPVEGAIASGASRWQSIRYAAVPQVLSNFISYALLRFEINVRGASVMGFVGAGGIGQDLIESIRKFYYSDVSAILLLIIAAVMLIDFGTERLRHALISAERGR